MAGDFAGASSAHFLLGCFLGMIWGFSRLFVKGASGRQRYNPISTVKRRELRRGMGVPPMNSWARCPCHFSLPAVELWKSYYSLNLNLIERLWKLTKTKCLRNRYSPDFARFTSAIDSFLDTINSSKNPDL